ncbi:MAG: VOC family protein [Methylococcaceae bacterium]|jgi:PhnB protein
MALKNQPLPAAYPTLLPYLVVRRAAQAIEFYKHVFGAIEIIRLAAPDGSIGHAEINIGSAHIMLSEENQAWGSTSPETLGGSPVTLLIYVADVDAIFTAAIKAGAKEKMPLINQFWGDRSGQVIDPFGHHWHIATHIEDVDPNDLQQRMADAFSANHAK